eukprot:UN26436
MITCEVFLWPNQSSASPSSLRFLEKFELISFKNLYFDVFLKSYLIIRRTTDFRLKNS